MSVARGVREPRAVLHRGFARLAGVPLILALGACDGCRRGSVVDPASASPPSTAGADGSGDAVPSVDAPPETARLEAVWSTSVQARIVAVAFDDARGTAVATSAGTVAVIGGDGVVSQWASEPRLASTVALAWAPRGHDGLVAATRGEAPIVARVGEAGAPVDVAYALAGQPVDLRMDASDAGIVVRLLAHTDEGTALLTLNLGPSEQPAPAGALGDAAKGDGSGPPARAVESAADGSGTSARPAWAASLVDQQRLCSGAVGFFDVPGGHAVPCHDSQELVHLGSQSVQAESRTALVFRPVAVVALAGGLAVASAATSELAIQAVGAARQVPLAGPASALAVLDGDVVAVSPGASRITRVRAGGEVAATSEAATFPVALGVGDAGLWVLDADTTHPRVLLLHPETLTERASAPVGGRPAWVRASGTSAVVVSPGEGVVERFELRDR